MRYNTRRRGASETYGVLIIIATPAPTLLTGFILLAGTTGVPDGAGAFDEDEEATEVAGGFGAALTSAAAAKRVEANA